MTITDKSKIKKFNGEKLPQELKDISHWVAWKAEPIKNKNGEVQYSKVPYNVESGFKASTTNVNDWNNYNNAVQGQSQYDGLGFVLSESADIVFLDIDGCIKDGEFIESEGAELAQQLLGTTYCEYSPSGTGVHAYFKGVLRDNKNNRNDTLGLEVYNKGRYMTVTGDLIEGSIIALCDDQEIIDNVVGAYFYDEDATNINLSTGEGNDLTADEIIEIAINNKANGDKFTTLYEGDWTTLFGDQSSADMSFASYLAFWTNRDAEKMDEIFRQSKLYRAKWDEKRGHDTYGNITLNNAIKNCAEGYTGKKKTYSYDDTGNAERFRDYSQGVMKYNYDSKKWMAYDGKRWVADEGMRSKQMVDEVIKEMTNEPLFEVEGIPVETLQKERYRHIKETRNHNKKVNMLKEAHHLLSIRNKDFDKDLYSFNVQNGYIDLKNNKLLPHDKEQYLSKISKTSMEDTSDCPQWEKYLNDIFEDNQELISFVKRCIGYTLSGSTKEQVMFMLNGDGSNGKSIMISILNMIFGDYARNIKPQVLMASKFNNSESANPEIAKLDGARLVATTEPDENARFNEGLVKQLTGDDVVSARNLHENSFEFIPQFKVWMATNHKPYVIGKDVGIWRRFVIIPFNREFKKHEKDLQLLDKLKEELPGIMKWAVEGFEEWLAIGLQEPAIIDQQRDSYRAEMDTLEMFIDECAVRGETYIVKSSDLYRAYTNWASDNNEFVMTSTNFGKEMKRKFKSKKSNGIKYFGVKLQDDISETGHRLTAVS